MSINAIFFELATVMYWCLLGNSGSIASKLSIIAINPGHSYVKSRWLFKVLLSQSLPFITSIYGQHTTVYGPSLSYIFLLCHWTRKCICTNLLRGKCFAKIVKTEESLNVGKCPICLAIYTPSLFWYANVSFTIFAPYLLLSFYIFATYLQGANLCKSIFFLQWVMLSILSLCCCKKRKIISWAEGDRSKMGWCVVTSQDECNRKILFSTEY